MTETTYFSKRMRNDRSSRDALSPPFFPPLFFLGVVDAGPARSTPSWGRTPAGKVDD